LEDGTSRFVELIDDAHDEHGFDLMFSEWTKFYALFLAAGASNDPLMCYFCVEQYLAERSAGTSDKEFSRCALENSKAPFWMAKMNALRGIAALFAPVLTYTEVGMWSQIPEYGEAVGQQKDPNVFNAFLDSQRYQGVFGPKAPLGDSTYASWSRRLAMSVKEGLDFARDVLIDGTFDATFRNAVANKSPIDSDGIFEFGSLKGRYTAIKDAIVRDNLANTQAAAAAKAAEELAEQHVRDAPPTAALTPKEAAKAQLDRQLDALLGTKVFIFKRERNTQKMMDIVESKPVWKSAALDARRLWQNNLRIDNDFETRVVTFERKDVTGKRLSKAPFSLIPSIDEGYVKGIFDMFKKTSVSFDIALWSDGMSKAHNHTIMQAFPPSARVYRLREDLCVVYNEEDAKARRTQMKGCCLKLREIFWRVGHTPLPEAVSARRFLPRSGSTASDTMPNVPLMPVKDLPRVDEAQKKKIFMNVDSLPTSGGDDSQGQSDPPEPGTQVILCHHEPAMTLCQQLLEEHGAEKGVVFDTTPGAGTMLKAAMRSGAFYFGAAHNDDHLDYLVNVARKELQSGLERRYLTASMKSKLEEKGVKAADVYPQVMDHKRQKVLEELKTKKGGEGEDGGEDDADKAGKAANAKPVAVDKAGADGKDAAKANAVAAKPKGKPAGQEVEQEESEDESGDAEPEEEEEEDGRETKPAAKKAKKLTSGQSRKRKTGTTGRRGRDAKKAKAKAAADAK